MLASCGSAFVAKIDLQVDYFQLQIMTLLLSSCIQLHTFLSSNQYAQNHSGLFSLKIFYSSHYRTRDLNCESKIAMLSPSLSDLHNKNKHVNRLLAFTYIQMKQYSENLMYFLRAS